MPKQQKGGCRRATGEPGRSTRPAPVEAEFPGLMGTSLEASAFSFLRPLSWFHLSDFASPFPHSFPERIQRHLAYLIHPSSSKGVSRKGGHNHANQLPFITCSSGALSLREQGISETQERAPHHSHGHTGLNKTPIGWCTPTDPCRTVTWKHCETFI